MDFESDSFAFIVSANLRRRHLSDGQKSMVGLAIERHAAERAKERQGTRTDLHQNSGESSRNPQATKQAAAAVGVSHDSISRAKKIDAADIRAVEAADRAHQAAAPVNQHDKPVSSRHKQRPAGTTRAATLRRLRKDRPDLHAD